MKKLAYPLLALFTGFLIFLSYFFGLFTGLEYFLEDRLFQNKPVPKDIVIVAIDDDSIQKIGQWPWPRETFANFLEVLEKNPPKALAIDVVFSENSRLGPSDDQKLREALQNASYPVVLAVEATSLRLGDKVNIEKKLLPISLLQTKNTSLGLVNVISDSDGVVRRFPITGEDSESKVTFNAFAFELLERAKISVSNENTFLPINRIAYTAEPNTFRRIPFSQVLTDLNAQRSLEGKLVLLGATAADLHDTKPTPLSRGIEMPGVEIHANIAAQLLSGSRLVPLHSSLMLLWIILAALISSLFFISLERLWIIVLANSGIGITYLIFGILLFEQGIAVNLIHIELSWITTTIILSLYKFFVAEIEKREVRKTFEKYVSPSVLKEILKNPGSVSLGGEEREITVLFSDIRGFTSISEKTAPKEMVRILNEYFGAMTGKIIENDGVLDKYIGDAIMAFWGAPLAEPKQADKAVSAALSMLSELNKLNKKLLSQGDPEIKIGVGIYTGKAIVGNVGSEHRFDYTAIGDTVNIASRIEGLTKEYKTEIIIGESTKNKLTGSFQTTPLGTAQVKGKAEGVAIYSVTE